MIIVKYDATHPDVVSLMAEIELLEQKVLELNLKIESIQASQGWAQLNVKNEGSRNKNAKLLDFVRASMMPFIAGVFRLIYKAVYRKKK